jgi:hypothetical protein
VPAEILQALRSSPPLIASSKRCCPVCAAILDGLADGSSAYPIYANHSIVFGCALPPGLPNSVRNKVLDYFDGMLFAYLSDAMRERRMSDGSGQSEALSSNDEDDPNYKEFISRLKPHPLQHQSGLQR